MLDKVILQGKIVRLEPLTKEHHDELCIAVNDGELWASYVTPIPHPKAMRDYIKTALHQHLEGNGLCFVIVDTSSKEVIGCTRFSNIDKQHSRTNIGYTFIRQSHQGTGVNIEAKYLMLKYAFETLNIQRVEIVTDYFNYQSQRAILALGAKQEGLLRNHMILPDGRVRDSLVYSIITSEWASIERHLLARLRKHIPSTVQSKTTQSKDEKVVMMPQPTVNLALPNEDCRSLTEI